MSMRVKIPYLSMYAGKNIYHVLHEMKQIVELNSNKVQKVNAWSKLHRVGIFASLNQILKTIEAMSKY